ncbi:MAG: hypothetical protein ACK4TA_11945 [Saprospiraceae bacterium]
MDNTTLINLQTALRNLLTESIGDVIAEIKKHLPDYCPKYSALLLLEGRLNDANLQRIEGTLSDEDLQLRYNQLRADLLLFINALQVNDFALPVAGAPSAKTGSLLYKIPTQMTLQKETKCVVRLAYDKAVVIRNIELSSDVRIKPVRVAEVMQVELIDPTEPHPFAIRPISDEEQFLETDDYTEWVFYVEPLLEGTFPLVLKISVVEIIMGKERLRNLTYEESIQITAMPAEVAAPKFKPTGVTLDASVRETAGAVPGAAPAGESAPPAPPQILDVIEEIVLPEPDDIVLPSPAPVMPSAPTPQRYHDQQAEPPPPSRRRSILPLLAAAASVLLVLTVAIFSLNNNAAEKYPGYEILPNIQDSTAVFPVDSIQQDSL